MRGVSDGRAYAEDVPTMNGREALSLPRGCVVSNLGRSASFFLHILSPLGQMSYSIGFWPDYFGRLGRTLATLRSRALLFLRDNLGADASRRVSSTSQAYFLRTPVLLLPPPLLLCEIRHLLLLWPEA